MKVETSLLEEYRIALEQAPELLRNYDTIYRRWMELLCSKALVSVGVGPMADGCIEAKVRVDHVEMRDILREVRGECCETPSMCEEAFLLSIAASSVLECMHPLTLQGKPDIKAVTAFVGHWQYHTTHAVFSNTLRMMRAFAVAESNGRVPKDTNLRDHILEMERYVTVHFGEDDEVKSITVTNGIERAMSEDCVSPHSPSWKLFTMDAKAVRHQPLETILRGELVAH